MPNIVCIECNKSFFVSEDIFKHCPEMTCGHVCWTKYYKRTGHGLPKMVGDA